MSILRHCVLRCASFTVFCSCPSVCPLKLYHPWAGPFRVITRISDVTYCIQNVQSCLVAHFNLLKVCSLIWTKRKLLYFIQNIFCHLNLLGSTMMILMCITNSNPGIPADNTVLLSSLTLLNHTDWMWLGQILFKRGAVHDLILAQGRKHAVSSGLFMHPYLIMYLVWHFIPFHYFFLSCKWTTCSLQHIISSCSHFNWYSISWMAKASILMTASYG